MEIVDDLRPAYEFSDEALVQILRQRWEDARRYKGGLIAQDKGDHGIRKQLYARDISACILSQFA
jgi:hypothetical protein